MRMLYSPSSLGEPNMTVYVTYEKDGYGGSQIESIFSSQQKAINHVLDQNKSFCSNMNEKQKKRFRIALY